MGGLRAAAEELQRPAPPVVGVVQGAERVIDRVGAGPAQRHAPEVPAAQGGRAQEHGAHQAGPGGAPENLPRAARPGAARGRRRGPRRALWRPRGLVPEVIIVV